MRRSSLVLLVLLSCATRADLAVTSFSPRPTSQDPVTPIRIRFDRPVVAASAVGPPLASAPALLAPPAAVTAHWEDRQTLVLVPAQPLQPSTRYQVTLAGDLARRSRETSFSFVHQPLEVTGLAGVDPERVPPTPKLTLALSQPVAPADLLAHCRLVDAATLAAVPLALDGAALVPRQPLAQDRDYQLVCEKLVGQGGNEPLAEPFRGKLHTYPPFRVDARKPIGEEVSSDDVRLELTFSTPVGREAVARGLSATPPIRGLGRGWLDETRTRYTVEVDLEPHTTYTVTLAGGTVDEYGQKLSGDGAGAFTTGAALPRISMERGIYAVETGGRGYPVWTRAMTRFDLACARLGRADVVKVLGADIEYDPWYDPGHDAPIPFARLGLKPTVTAVKPAAVKNQWSKSELDLPRVCGGAPGDGRGLYLAEITSKEMKPEKDQEWRYQPRHRLLANVTDIGILLKAGPASGLLWAASIKDGKPVAGAAVTVFTPKGKQVFAGRTDESGLLRLPGTATLLPPPASEDEWRDQRLLALVEKDGDLAAVDGNWNDGVGTWSFGVEDDDAADATRIRGFIQSDRGIYRPGEEVGFKGLVREVEIGRPARLPRQREVELHVEDARGQSLLDQKLPLSPFGGFAFTLPLAAEATLGDYQVTAKIAGQTFRESFIVQAFRKVELELTVGRTAAELRGQVSFAAQARYLFGAPVAAARVSYRVQRRPHELDFKSFRDFVFGDRAPFEEGEWIPRDLTFVTDGEARTDGQGAFAFAIVDKEDKLVGPQDYLAEVSVTDATGQTVSKELAAVAQSSDFYVGVRVGDYVQAVDKPFTVSAVAVDAGGKQVAARARLSLARNLPDCRTSGDVRPYVTCRDRRETLWERELSLPASGAGSERIVPAAPGEYIVRLEAEDGHGRKTATTDWIWVLGPGEASWSGDDGERMTISTGKPSYQPGDTARLVPLTSLSGGTALVTLERNGIFEARVVPMSSTGQGIDVKLGLEHAPNVFASIAVVRGRTAPGDAGRPRFQIGVLDLPVSAESQRLRVEVVTDKESYQPGDAVAGTIRVHDEAGKPVAAEVSLSVADEGVLQLIAYKTPDPMAAFYKPWGLAIDNATSWTRIARPADPTVAWPEEGGDSGDPSRNARSRFVSSAFWAPSLLTDGKGEVRFAFQAPDNLTAFRLMAVAADTGARFGSGDSRLTLRKPFLLQPVVPRFLSEGDRAELGVVVRNDTGAAGVASVTAKIDDASAEKTVKVDAGGTARLDFPVVAGGAAEMALGFAARLGGHGDALKLSLPVNRPLVVDKTTPGRGRLLERAVEVPLAWDAATLRAESTLEVSVDRTGLAELSPSLRYLVEYPYGCLEQTLSRTIPLVAVKDLVLTLRLADLDAARIDAFVRAGVAKVAGFQQDDGHFSLWQTGQSYPHLTAYALYGLAMARRAGVKVDEAVVKRGATALKEWAAAKERVLGARGDGAVMAMAAHDLADLGQPDAALAARLFEARRGLPVWGQAFLLSALQLGKAPRKQVTALENELLARLVRTGSEVIVKESDPDWQLAHYMSSDARSTAITLSALLLVDPQNPVVDTLADGLKKAQRPSGRWSNTQDNLFGIVALAAYARRAAAGSATVTVTAGERKLAEGKLTGGEALVARVSLADLAPGALRIAADGPIFYAVRLAAARKEAAPAAEDRGFALERAYLDPDSRKPVEGALKVGQLVRVKVSLTVKKTRNWVVLVDPLPAGLEIVNTRLATSVRRAETPDDDNDYWNPPVWSHIELHDDRAQAFADVMEPGTHTFEYLARATLPGTFRAPPARAEAMYEADLNGRTAAREVTVTR